MLRIVEIVIHGHKILGVNGYETLTVTPESAYQLILGTNGAGKSVFMKEIIRVVSSGKAYSKGGYKRITYRKDDDIIEVKSTYDKTAGHHEFTLNGDNLNEGGTAKVQKELVVKHLGYTEDLYDLITGKVKFTNMIAQQRKTWVTKLSNSKLDYAFKQYNHYRKMERESKVLLKHVVNRTGELKQELASLGSRDSIRNELELLTNQLDQSMRGLTANGVSFSEAENGLTQLSNTLISHNKAIGKILPRVQRLVSPYDDPVRLGFSVETAPGKIEELVQAIDQRNELIYNITKKLDETTQRDEGYTIEQVDAIIKEKNAILSGTVELPKQLFEHIDVQTIKDALSISDDRLAGVCYNVTEALMGMADNSEGLYTNAKLNVAEKELEECLLKKNEAQSEYNTVTDNLIRYENSPKVICPSCSHSFKEGMHEDHVKQWRATAELNSSVIDGLNTTIGTLREYIESCRQFVNEIRYVQSLCNDSGIPVLFQILRDHKFYLSKPSEFTLIVDGVLELGRDTNMKRHAKEQLDHYTKLKDILTASNSDQIEEWKRTISKTQLEVNTYLKEKRHLEEHIRQAKPVLEMYGEVSYHYECISKIVKEIDTSREALLTAASDEVTNRAIVSQQLIVSDLRSTLMKIESITEMIRQNEEQAKAFEVDLETAAKTAAALNPSDGFIAKQIFYYLEAIVGRMNDTISEIWHTGLEVLPCDNDDGDLDYKFPVRREDVADLVPDISDCSLGQMEIINFAFVKVVLELSGLMQHPLFLDELGANFDEYHRGMTMSYIKNLVVKSENPQVWMISHYATQHGTFQQPDVLVVNDSNITKPERYNTHVTFE